MPRMINSTDERFTKLMLAARQSPEFGLRLLSRLPAPERAEALRRWCLPAPVEAAAEPRGPGLRKCVAQPAPAKTYQSAQLESFARALGRVG